MAFSVNDEVFFDLRDENQKYHKKKSIKNALKSVVMATMYTTLGLITIPETMNAIKIDTQNYKSNVQILEDAKHFNADMRVAEYFGSANPFSKTKFKRLPHNNDAPIFVGVSEKFDAVEKDKIKNIFNYYEDLLSAINPHYKFKLVSQGEAYLQSLIGNNVLYFGEGDLLPGKYGVNFARSNLLNANFVKDSIIRIKDYFRSEQYQYYTFMHETAHSIGLGDIYTTEINHGDTFMYGSDFAVSMQMLFPNDVAMLYAMYGENFRNNDNKIDENKLASSKQSFEVYKDRFYEKAVQIIADIYQLGNKGNIDAETIQNKVFAYEAYGYNPKAGDAEIFKYRIRVVDENNASFVILNEKNEVLWETLTRYDYYDGAIFFPSLYFEKGKFPTLHDLGENFSQISPKSSEFMVIALYNGNYQLLTPDKLIKMKLNLQDKNTEMTYIRKSDEIKEITKKEISIAL